jgi:two-component system response regulator HydG
MEIPTLRHRREDIPLLAQYFMENFCAKNRKKIKGYTPRAMEYLIKYDWPGNVRELMNAVERAVVLSRTDYLTDTDFPVIQGTVASNQASQPGIQEPGFAGDTSLEEIEKATILKTLEAAGGNKSETARRLGITRKTLHKKLKAGVMK